MTLRGGSQLKPMLLENRDSFSQYSKVNAVQYIVILSTVLQRQQQNINEISNSQNLPYILPSRDSYGAPVVRILGKVGSVIAASHCMSLPVFLLFVYWLGGTIKRTISSHGLELVLRMQQWKYRSNFSFNSQGNYFTRYISKKNSLVN